MIFGTERYLEKIIVHDISNNSTENNSFHMLISRILRIFPTGRYLKKEYLNKFVNIYSQLQCRPEIISHPKQVAKARSFITGILSCCRINKTKPRNDIYFTFYYLVVGYGGYS